MPRDEKATGLLSTDLHLEDTNRAAAVSSAGGGISAGRAVRLRPARRRRAHRSVAEAAIEGLTESSAPALGVENPRPKLKRGPVADVALVAAVELGDPVALLVLVVADDRTFHTARVRGVRCLGLSRRHAHELARDRELRAASSREAVTLLLAPDEATCFESAQDREERTVAHAAGERGPVRVARDESKHPSFRHTAG